MLRSFSVVFKVNIIFISIFVFSIPSLAQVQNSEQKKNDSLQIFFGKDVIVTANRRVQNVQEISNSAFIIDKGKLRNSDENNFEQLLKEVPGIEVYDETISIRGSDGFDFGIGSRTLMMFEGIPLMSGDNGDAKFNLIPLNQISAVEIVKGAGSALYGSSAIGGVINLISLKGKDFHEYDKNNIKADIQTTYGIYTPNRYAQWRYTDDLSPKLNSIVTLSHKKSKYGLVISGNVESDYSYRDFDDKKKFGLFGQIYYNIKGTEFNLFGLYNSSDNADWVYWNSLDSATRPPANTDKSVRLNSRKGMLGITSTHYLSAASFLTNKFSLFYTNFQNNLTRENIDFRSSDAVSTYYDLQWTTNLNPQFTLTSGFTFTQNNVSSFSYGLRNQKIFAIYSQVEFKPSDIYSINLGGRYDYEMVRDAESNYEISPKLGINYSLSEKSHLRASIGKGFRAPGIAERFASISYQGFKIIENPDLKPETSWNFEIGGNFRNDDIIPFEIDGTIFANFYDHLIEPGFTDEFYSTVKFQNITSARISGIELSLNEMLSNNLIFSQSFTYLDPVDTDLNEVLKFRSKYYVNTTLSYIFGSFRTSLSYRFSSKVERIDDKLVLQVKDAQARVPMHVVDFFAGAEIKNSQTPFLGYYFSMDIGLNVYNLLDYYYTYMVGNLAPTRYIGLTLKLGI